MIKFTALTAAALMLIGVASADQHEGGEREKGGKMAKIDTNGDGFVSKDEMLAAHAERVNKHFAKMDTNNDGKLSKEEMKAGKKDMRKKMKERMKKVKERKEAKDAE